MADVKITVFDNGPIEVVGSFTVLDEGGKPLDVEAGEPVFLCRCGQSHEKPFCDGTHQDCGFAHKLTK